MNNMAVVCFVLVAVGVLLILIGAYISVLDWRRKFAGKIETQEDDLGNTLTGLGKLADALKGYPLGQQLIVWGIVILVLAGIFGGVGNMK
jgi:hypothetical protein